MSLEKSNSTEIEIHIDEKQSSSYDQEAGSRQSVSSGIQTIDEQKLLRKIDIHVVPVLCILYLLAFLDRVNISNAALFGLKQDLKLGGDQYNTAIVIFFVPCVLFDLPSNVFLKRFKPHVWLSACMFFFGLTTTFQGLSQSYGGLLTARFFLGLFESGMFPGCYYVLSMWYTRAESQKRYTFFFTSTVLAGAFGGLLASAIGKMDGMRGYHGWRWVFILEGVATCLIAILFYFLISDFPEEAKWLTPEERDYVKLRLRKDVGASLRHESMTPREIITVIKEWKILLGGFMYFGLIVPAYGYAYFSPAIIQGLGHSSIRSQLLSVGPYACSFASAMIVAFISDRLRHRFMFTIIPSAVALAGFAILAVVHNNVHLQYAALFIASAGTYSSMPVVICWFNANLCGHRRRAIGTAWQIGFGNIGGIISAYAFLAKDAPKYKAGFSICLSFVCLSMLACVVYFIHITWLNRQREKSGAGTSEWSEEEKEELGDLNPDYRYWQ